MKKEFVHRLFLTFWLMGLGTILLGVIVNLAINGFFTSLYSQCMGIAIASIIAIKAWPIGSIIMLGGGCFLIAGVVVAIIGTCKK